MGRATPRAPGTERSLVASLGVDLLQTARSGGLLRPVHVDGTRRSQRVGDRAAFAAMDQIFGIRDLSRQIGVHRTAEVGHGLVIPIGAAAGAPIGAAGNNRSAASDDD